MSISAYKGTSLAFESTYKNEIVTASLSSYNARVNAVLNDIYKAGEVQLEHIDPALVKKMICTGLVAVQNNKEVRPAFNAKVSGSKLLITKAGCELIGQPHNLQH